MIVKKGTILNCPCCEKDMDDPVENFVVPGRPDGQQCEEQCGWCDATIYVTQRKKGEEFEVYAQDEAGEYYGED